MSIKKVVMGLNGRTADHLTRKQQFFEAWSSIRSYLSHSSFIALPRTTLRNLYNDGFFLADAWTDPSNTTIHTESGTVSVPSNVVWRLTGFHMTLMPVDISMNILVTPLVLRDDIKHKICRFQKPVVLIENGEFIVEYGAIGATPLYFRWNGETCYGRYERIDHGQLPFPISV